MGMVGGSLRSSITEINNNLIITLAAEMDDEDLASFSESVTLFSHGRKLNGAVIDFSMVQVLDSYTLEVLLSLSKHITLLGAEVVWVGLKPGVVIGLIDLNIDLDQLKFRTALNLDRGLVLLQKGQNS